ncbi:MAG: sigma factor [Planctomycetota bacterium]|nr:sigma factor [Planctomycetota bacterium]
MEQQWSSWRRCARGYFRRRLRDENEIDELVQETCVRAWISGRDGRGVRVQRSWVLGISWRVYADYCRDARMRRRLPYGCVADVPGVVRERTLRVCDGEYRLSHLLRILYEEVHNLSGDDRSLVGDRLRGLRVSEVARLHDMTVHMVKRRLYRGRRRLKAAILERLQEDEDVVQFIK